MLIVEGTVRIDAEGRDATLAALADMIPATLAEEGCQVYRFAWDVDDDTLLHIHEHWDDQDALDAHLASDHMRTFNAAFGEVLAGPPDLRIHEVGGTRPMFGD